LESVNSGEWPGSPAGVATAALMSVGEMRAEAAAMASRLLTLH
jgi:hypothetical protein